MAVPPSGDANGKQTGAINHPLITAMASQLILGHGRRVSQHTTAGPGIPGNEVPVEGTIVSGVSSCTSSGGTLSWSAAAVRTSQQTRAE